MAFLRPRDILLPIPGDMLCYRHTSARCKSLSSVFLVSVAGGGYSDLWQRNGHFLKATAGDVPCVLEGYEVPGRRGLSAAVDPLGLRQE